MLVFACLNDFRRDIPRKWMGQVAFPKPASLFVRNAIQLTGDHFCGLDCSLEVAAVEGGGKVLN